MKEKITFKILDKNKHALTPFEWNVLKTVSRIPLGETRSYAWVAQKAGRPGAQRAVGGALRKNPFLLLVPCHRVIAQDGTPGGFSAGVKTKKRLLALEKKIKEQFCQKSF